MALDALVGAYRDQAELAAAGGHPARMPSKLACRQVVPGEKRYRDIGDFHGGRSPVQKWHWIERALYPAMFGIAQTALRSEQTVIVLF
jgi:hypothetical protein